MRTVKLDHFPRDHGENKKCLSCHHLVLVSGSVNLLFSPRMDAFASFYGIQ